MSNATMTRLQAERETQAAFISELLAQVETEGRDLVDAERQNITHAETRMAEIDEQLEPLVKFEQRRAAAVDISQLAAGSTRPAPSAETRSLGVIFTESEQFRSYKGRGSSQVVNVPEFRAVGPDPLLTTTTPGSVLMPNPQQFRGPEHYMPLPLLSLVGRIEVSGNSVTYVTTTDATGANTVAEGEQKPPVSWEAAEVPYTLETIAGWFRYSRQALADIPAIRDLVDQKIRRSIDKKLNSLAVAALDGAFTAGNTTTGAAGESLIAVIRKAVAELEEEGIAPTAVLVSPADHAALDLDLLGKPLGVASINGGAWGLPIVSVPGLAYPVVGDISEGVVYFQRTGLEMYTTDSDIIDGATVKSAFRANLLTTLGEVRGKFAAVDPAVMRKVVTTAAAAAAQTATK